MIEEFLLQKRAPLLLNPFENPVSDVMKRIKGSSAREVNRLTGDFGSLWQREYFDRQLRSDEDVRAKAEYIAMNPVRAGLVTKPDDYPWLWRAWIEGEMTGDDIDRWSTGFSR